MSLMHGPRLPSEQTAVASYSIIQSFNGLDKPNAWTTTAPLQSIIIIIRVNRASGSRELGTTLKPLPLSPALAHFRIHSDVCRLVGDAQYRRDTGADVRAITALYDVPQRERFAC